MATFQYEAYDASGRFVRGKVEARNRETALIELSRRGTVPIDVVETREAAAQAPWWNRDLFASSLLPTPVLATMTRELATLLNAEIAIDETLRIISVQPLISERTRSLIKVVLARVVEGSSLSEALARTGRFPEYYVKLIEAGELSGSLGSVAGELASLLERSANLRQKVTSALVYPAVLLVMAILALITITTVLLPTIMPIFKDAGVQPPFIMRVLSMVEEVVSEHLLVVAGGSVVLLVGLQRLFDNSKVATARDRLFMKLPIVAGLIEKSETGRFARSLGTMLKNGVSMVDGLEIAGGVVSNRAFREAVRKVHEDVVRGSGLTAPMTATELFPELCLRLVATGEQTGQLDVMLARVADIYDASLQRDLERLTTLLTPLLTVVIGLSVGGLILSVMSALLSINDLALR